jgi:hypothetical protein
MATLHVIRDTNLLDMPATLRNIADNIERGLYGEANGCVVVLDAEEVSLFYCGTGEAAPNAHLLLGVGQAYMQNRVLEKKQNG